MPTLCAIVESTPPPMGPSMTWGPVFVQAILFSPRGKFDCAGPILPNLVRKGALGGHPRPLPVSGGRRCLGCHSCALKTTPLACCETPDRIVFSAYIFGDYVLLHSNNVDAFVSYVTVVMYCNRLLCTTSYDPNVEAQQTNFGGYHHLSYFSVIVGSRNVVIAQD